MATDTYYPDANPETNTVDGFVYTGDFGVTNFTWAEVHDAADSADANGSADSSDVNASVFVTADTLTDRWQGISRIAILFDTSSLSDTDVISSAKVYLYIASILADDFADSLDVVAVTPASDTDIVSGDFDQFGTTSYGSVSVSGCSNGAYVAITLNASGRAAINLSGITKFGIRCGKDRSNSSTWSVDGSTNVSISTADESGSGQDPYLEIVHNAPSAGVRTSTLSMMGVG